MVTSPSIVWSYWIGGGDGMTTAAGGMTCPGAVPWARRPVVASRVASAVAIALASAIRIQFPAVTGPPVGVGAVFQHQIWIVPWRVRGRVGGFPVDLEVFHSLVQFNQPDGLEQPPLPGPPVVCGRGDGEVVVNPDGVLWMV